jgi:nucleoside-diphosphate-sugar epimerase
MTTDASGTPRKLRVGITGARGFIGRHAVESFAARGFETHAYQRAAAPSPFAGVTVHRFEMPDAIDERSFEGLGVLIHGALVEYGPAHRDADRVNLAGAERVIAIARHHGTRLIFLSTLSAHDGARSHYGLNKLELERRFDPARDCILRLGLVLGNGGLFGGMVDAIRGSQFVPLPDGGRQPIQTLWMGDLLDVLERVATRAVTGRYDLATSEVYTMRELYQSLIDGLGVKRTLVPVPLALVGFGVSVLETLRIPFSINRENVLGLQCLRAFDNVSDLAALELKPLSLRESVAKLLAPGQAAP